MIISLAPSQSQVLQALRVNFLQNVLPQGSALFQGSINGTLMSVVSVQSGTIAVGDAVFGANVPADTFISAFGTGTGGIGTYTLNQAPSNPIARQPLNTGVIVLLGQANRISEPAAQSFVVMTPIYRERLETNVDSYVDCFFQASIGGTDDDVLTVDSIAYGKLTVGAQLFGNGIAVNTLILSQLSGPAGGLGTYKLNNSQIVSQQGMACGVNKMLQPVKLTVQLDVHGPGSADYALIISTAFRDDYGAQLFAASGFDVAPLYADDPKQVPFINAEQEFEDRWIVEATMQANQSVVVPQQFFDNIQVNLKNVDATYPP